MSFIGENEVHQNALLSKICVYNTATANSQLGQYDFEYYSAEMGTRYYYSRLKSITFTSDGYRYKPTMVNWGSDIGMSTYEGIRLDGGFVFDENYGDRPSRLNGVKFTGDFNGDGYTDVIGRGSPHESGKLHVFLNTGRPDREQVGFTDAYCMDRDPQLDWIYVGDFNGDGLDDFMCTIREFGALWDHIVLIPYLTRKNDDGTIWFEQGEMPQDDYWIGKRKQLTLVMGDFLGNKRMSFIFQTHRESKRHHKYIYFKGNDPNGIEFDHENVPDLNAECIRAADFDGDGITELWYYTANGNDWYGHMVKLTSDFQYEIVNNEVLTRKDNAFVGDFNGDGHSDFLSYSEHEGKWIIRLWKQTDRYWQSFDITGLMPFGDPGDHGFSIVGHCDGRYQAVEVADFNGDGKSDIAVIDRAGTVDARLVILYAPFTANGCAYQHEISVYDTDIELQAQQNICVGNFLGRENVSFFSSHSLFSINPMTKRYNVANITDGMGNRVAFNFQYLMPNMESPGSDNFYRLTRNQPMVDNSGCFVVSLPMKGVKSIVKSNINDHFNRVKESIGFRYQDVIVHNRGRGFLGFETIWKDEGWIWDNSVPKSYTKQHFSLNLLWNIPVLMMDYDSCLVKPGGSNERIVSSASTYYYEKMLNSYNNMVYMPLLTKKTTDQYDVYHSGQFLNRTIVKNSFVSDGRMTESFFYNKTVQNSSTIQATGLTSAQNNVNNAEYRTISENAYQPEDYDAWIINRPMSTKVSTFSQDDLEHPIVSMVTFDYEDANPFKVTRQTTYPGGSINPSDPLATFTAYVYDFRGNVKLSTSGDILGSLPESMVENVYSEDARQLMRQTNQAGYETSYTYDERFGYCNSVTDGNGLLTRYGIVSMGASSRTDYPDGTMFNSYTDFVNNSDYMRPEGAKYYTGTQKTGEAPTKVYYDATGRKLRELTFGFDGKAICVDTKYDGFGLVEKISEPFFYENCGNEKYTVFKYDAFKKVYKTIAPDETSVATLTDGFTSTTTSRPKPNSDLPNQITTTTVNSAGWIVESVDAHGTAVHYGYYPDGQLRWSQIGEDESTRICLEYDNARNRTKLVDPNYGEMNSVYNAYGQLVMNTDPKGNTTESFYDNMGRTTVRIETNAETNETETTSWHYDVSGKDRLDCINSNNQTIQYAYDALGRVITYREKHPNQEEVATQYQYDELSRIRKVVYPTGYSIRKIYNDNGYLQKILSNDYEPLWETKTVNEFGQIVEYQLGDKIMGAKGYDEMHRLNLSVSKANHQIIQDFSYSYNDFSNLATRNDNRRGLEESFKYDNLNRLTTISMNGIDNHIEYDAYGRIISKMTDGQSVFDNAQYNTFDNNGMLKPHAISEASMSTAFALPTQSITYTMFDKVKTITQDNRELVYEYGHDHQRISMEEKLNGRTIATKQYYGNCEIINKGYDIPHTYLSGPLGTFAVVRRVAGSNQVSFILKDHLGSWTTITDADGHIQQELSYDAWGNLRDPETWSGQFEGTPMLDRGYTGHEHLYAFGLINMNGRMYDPVMSSFLSVDNYVQSPDNSQSFNRYAYCLNNPLKYVDPSGEVAIVDDIACAVVIGAISSVLINGFNNTANDKDFWDGGLRAFAAGAVSGLVGGCFSIIGGAGMSYASNLLLGTVEGSATGALYEWIKGGSKEDIAKAAAWGAAFGAVATTLTSENLSNAIRGKGFKTNENVFADFKAGKYTAEGGCWQQEVIDYFFGKGWATYTQKYGNDAWYGSITGMHFSDGAFTSYDDLICSNYKETMERMRYQTDTWERPANPTGVYSIDVYQAEYRGHVDLYKNQGLYPNITTDLSKPIRFCIDKMESINFYGEYGDEPVFIIPSFEEKWWHIIYRIPRRY